ncbi:MAG: hypothetical protein IJ512_05075 [Ruminococcus sp.]|nr:hypothetical protein [Ruminococcus sp.]
MENQHIQKSVPVSNPEEMKIYTPRSASHMRKEKPAANILDQAPVRIYERPVKSDFVFLSEHNDIG